MAVVCAVCGLVRPEGAECPYCGLRRAVTELEEGVPVIIKQLGLRGVVIGDVKEYPPGYASAEVRRDHDGLSAWYLIENLEVVEEI